MVEAAFKAIRDHGSRVTFVITELLGLALWLSFWPETQMIHSSNSFGSMHCQFRGALLQCSVSWQQWHSDKSRIAFIFDVFAWISIFFRNLSFCDFWTEHFVDCVTYSTEQSKHQSTIYFHEIPVYWISFITVPNPGTGWVRLE
jgi:hypothetical protein